MMTRMEIAYKSKEPCGAKPAIFTTGGYRLNVGARELHFDFTDMEASTEIIDGYLHITAVQKNFDDSLIDTYLFTPSGVDIALRLAKKEDFTEIYYECFADKDEEQFIDLEPLSIVFYNFSADGDGEPNEVEGTAFSNLI